VGWSLTTTTPPDAVKPLALMRWLVRLVTPTGGVVLDPFLGSGTTALACQREGFDCIGIERDAHSVEIAQRRLNDDAGMFADVGVSA
jgi:DNA modification methylase